jgi:hypothetical protein
MLNISSQNKRTNEKPKTMTKNEIIQAITHLGRKPVEFEPVPVIDDEEDELAQAVQDPIYHDNKWDLREQVDVDALQAFWDDATEELGPDSTNSDVQ